MTVNNNKIQILGIAGTNGSGKDTLGQLLAEKHNYFFISVTDLLRDEARQRGLTVSRENLRKISAEWRREFGLGVLIDKAVEEYKAKQEKYSGVVMASLRNPGEVERVHELDGQVVWLDADSRLRYDRIQANAHLRGRLGEDEKTFDEFLKEEEEEMSHSGDEATLNMAGVKNSSDIFIVNNQSDLDVFEAEIKRALEL
jgi:cytidylate kinase